MYYGLLRLGFKETDFVLRDDSDGKGAYIDEWYSDKPQPSASEIQTAQDAYDAEYASNKYQRDRKIEYPDMGDQFDMLWHAIDDGTLDKTSDFYTALKAVKDKYPKE